MFRKLLRLLFGLPVESDSDQVSSQRLDVAETDSPLDIDRFVPGFAEKGKDVSTGTSEPKPFGKIRRSREEIQAAATAKRNARQQAARERHASDITFLGHGVSHGLQDRTCDEQKLTGNALPILSTPGELARALGLTIPRLRWLAFHKDSITRSHYYTFQIPRRNGRPRTLHAPHQTLACVQGRILDDILYQIPVHPAAHGFVPGRSVVTNARPHLKARVVVNMDLKDFFPTITFARVNGLFRSFGYSPAVSTIMALLCTEAPRDEQTFDGQRHLVASGPRALPQGACTSPLISNLICRRLDVRLQGLANKLGWTYTRYADDLTWSASEEPRPSVGYVMARIRHIAADEGFTVNEEKTRVLRPHQRQSVTGVTVNDRPGVPRQTVRRIRAILHNAQFTGLHQQNRENHPHFEQWLSGMIGWIRMVQPETGDKLQLQLDQLLGR